METETVKPALTTRIEFIIHRPAVYYCQLCGTWCYEVYNHTHDVWEYHCYHHGLVAEVHKPYVEVSEQTKADLRYKMEMAICEVCGESFKRLKTSWQGREYMQTY